MIRLRTTLWPALIIAITLMALAAAWFGLLLVAPLTVGLPTALGVLAVVTVWNGPPLWAFLLLAALAGFTLQTLTHAALLRWRRRGCAVTGP